MSCSWAVISQRRVGEAGLGACSAGTDLSVDPSPRTDLSPFGRPGPRPASLLGIRHSPEATPCPGRERSPRPSRDPRPDASFRTDRQSEGSPAAGPDSSLEAAAPRALAPPNHAAVATTSCAPCAHTAGLVRIRPPGRGLGRRMELRDPVGTQQAVHPRRPSAVLLAWAQSQALSQVPPDPTRRSLPGGALAALRIGLDKPQDWLRITSAREHRQPSEAAVVD
jgi:hypothetical protein